MIRFTRLLPLLALSLIAAACNGEVVVGGQRPAQLLVVSGDLQTDTVGKELAQPLVVRVVDDKDRPVRGQLVNFVVTAGGGSVFAGAALTNADGEARERWTLGTVAGDTQRVEARAVDASTGQALVFATFRAIGVADVPAAAAPVGATARTGTAGTAVADSLAVRVVDRYGNGVPGAAVTFAAASGGSVSPAGTVTRADGTARAQWTLGPAAGPQTATATAAGLPAVTFTAAAGTGAVTRVVLSPDSISFRSLGQTQALTVQAYDALGNLVGGQQATIISQNAAVVALDAGSIARATGDGTTRLIATVQGSAAADTTVVTVQQVPLMAQSIAVASGHSCAVEPGGRAVCWGSNYSGGLGRTETSRCGFSGSLQCELIPATVEGGITFASVSAGPGGGASYPTAHTCGLTASGQAYCWGTNRFGQLGDGTTTSRPTPVAVAGSLRFRKLTVGDNLTCGIAMDDKAYCWGAGALGYSASSTCGTRSCELLPHPVDGGLAFTEIATTGVFEISHTCALTSTGAAYCWGGNSYGQLGTSEGSTESPAPVATSLTFRSIAVGNTFTCAVTGGGTAYCWGRNEMGQLGTSVGTSFTGPNRIPVAVAGGRTYDKVFAGMGHACGITPSGQAYCWGRGSEGQVGNGGSGYYAAPQAVSGGLAWAALDLGSVHTCGIERSGKAYCWGANEMGLLGTGDANPSSVPVLVHERER